MAESIVEPSGSASVVSSISSMVQNQQQSVSHNPINPNIIPIISADIQVDSNVVVTSAAAAAAVSAAVSLQQQRPPTSTTATNNNNNNNDTTDEPDIKRKKFDTAVQPSTSQLSEKLESRLGGILCCAVCLDLPKTAMYQVGDYFHFVFFLFHFVWFFFHFLIFSSILFANFV